MVEAEIMYDNNNELIVEKKNLKQYILTNNSNKLLLKFLLFILTFLTMTAAGAMLKGRYFWEGQEAFFTGIPYAFALMMILTCHEMGHYIAAYKYGVDSSLPFYVPFWIPIFNLGTMGAFIKIKSPIPHKKALLDIGLFGPLAGFIATVIFLAIGYYNLPDTNGIIKYIETIHPGNAPEQAGTNLTLGTSLLFHFFNDILAGGRLPMNEIYHFPFIFAGWVGLLVTAINLMPVGQLDGGHIAYALFGNRAKYISFAAFAVLILLNVFSLNYLVWTILIFFIVRFKHPPTENDHIPLTKGRIVLGWLGYIIFVLSFIPVPFVIY